MLGSCAGEVFGIFEVIMSINEKNEKVFTLRIKNELFERIKKDAEDNKRSITKHIEYILENSLKSEK